MSKEFLQEELAIFRKKFDADFKSKIPLLDVILKYVIKTKGKQMRPRFVLTSAAMYGTINEKTYRSASLIELLHTATLIHDDVVDDSFKRRKRFSINALWKNKIAVLVGDFLLSKGLLLSLDNDDFQELKIVSKAVKLMSEGELLQIEKARKLDIKEDIYYQIITAKTASLLAASCAVGAHSTTQDAAITEQMRQFGEYLGISFQIKDDLLDFGDEDIGKPRGIDIKEKKMTLPLIFTLGQCDTSTKNEIIRLIKTKSNIKSSIDFIINEVKQCGGIEYATEAMLAYQQKAKDMLGQFPNNEAREEMYRLVDKVTARKY